ncbi:hypothetical protein BCR36DRAFT_409504 [Piromyces finnis]|uniref:ARID domain-containing protein n=1 Tax=Piromyces finnis TaxID=1754191 RepID=A0A1Y1VJE7_9FUNG|nr:hypothetical protein BCR36DRAFT_409504 [Piromyces finnis]|eukprot:ORX57182.1 hypothetical protein BCR36DRAFT_409504 [Piromyces finnis]
MNPNSYFYNTQKQNYIPPIKDNQELLMQRNLYYNDNKGQPSQPLYGIMSNSNILNSQVYQQQANLNSTQIQSLNIANQQLPIPQDINTNSKIKYVDTFQMSNNQPNQSLSQDWLNINNPIAINRIQSNPQPGKNPAFDNRILSKNQATSQQQPGQSVIGPQKNTPSLNKDNSKTLSFTHANLPTQQQQQQQSTQNTKVPIAIDTRNAFTNDNSAGFKLSPTHQNLANSIIQYKKGVMEGTRKPEPSFEKYINQCFGILSHQEQVEITKYIQTFQNENNSNANVKANANKEAVVSPNPLSNQYLTNKNNTTQQNQQPSIIKNEAFSTQEKKPVTSVNKPKYAIRHLTKHDLNSLKYMIDSREKFDDLFYRHFLKAKYKYFTPLQISGKNIDYYDIYSLLSFFGFEKLDSAGDGVWDQIIRTLNIYPDPSRIRSLLKAHCLPVFQPFNEFLLNDFKIPPEEVETTNENLPIPNEPIPSQSQSMMPNYMSINQISQNQIPQNQIPQNQIPQNQPPQNRLSANHLPQSQLPINSLPQNQTQQPISQPISQPQVIKQPMSHSIIQSQPQSQTQVTQPPVSYNDKPQSASPKKNDISNYNPSTNYSFKNYEPKIKTVENLSDETLNMIDKYVMDPEPKGVEELGLITTHSLEMQLKSGLDTEIVHALNTLSIISSDVYTNFSLVNDTELISVMTDMLDDCLKKFKLISSDDDIISISKLYDMEKDDFEQVYAPTIHRKTLKEEEKIKNRSLCLGNIFRNLSFIPDNQALFAQDTRLLQIILTTFKIQCDAHYLQDRESMDNDISSITNENVDQDCCYSETASCILEHRKNGIIFFSNISAYIKLPNEDFSSTLITILKDVIINSDDPFYSYPALEAIGKLGISDVNKNKLSSIAIDWYDIIDYTISLLPQDGLTLDIEPEDIAQIEIVMLNFYNICTFDDELKSKLANYPGFIPLMLRLSLYPNEFTNYLIQRNENNPMMFMYESPLFTQSRCQYYIQTLTPICQRAMRILHEISLYKETRSLFYPYEAKLVEISMFNMNIINKEISQLAGEILSSLREKELEFNL